MAPRTAPTPAAETAPTREPIAERGTDLLRLIDGAEQDEENEDGGLRLTQDEAHEAISAGHAQADAETVDGEQTAVVTLTDAGKAALTSGGVANLAEPAAPSSGAYEVETSVPLPTTKRRRGGGSDYPFATMPVGASFHVPKTKENPDPANRLASSVSVARTKYSHDDPSGETEQYTSRTYKRLPEGQKGFVKDAEGKRVIDTETTATRVKRVQTKDFDVHTVGSEDPKGEGARCWRTL